MDDDAIPDRIEGLEQEIEALAESVARSRRLILLSRCVAGSGGLWLAGCLLGLAPAGPAGLVFAVAAVIGGIVFAGSSRSTIEENETAMRRAETLRARLIDAIAPAEIVPVASRPEAERGEARILPFPGVARRG